MPAPDRRIAVHDKHGRRQGPHIKEAWVSYKGILDPFTFKVGAMPTPANLSDMTSSDDLLFNERPSPAQLSRDWTRMTVANPSASSATARSGMRRCS